VKGSPGGGKKTFPEAEHEAQPLEYEPGAKKGIQHTVSAKEKIKGFVWEESVLRPGEKDKNKKKEKQGDAESTLHAVRFREQEPSFERRQNGSKDPKAEKKGVWLHPPQEKEKPLMEVCLEGSPIRRKMDPSENAKTTTGRKRSKREKKSDTSFQEGRWEKGKGGKKRVPFDEKSWRK